MPRSVSEWVGRNDDAKIPDRVRQRIFDQDGGVCHWCKQPIKVGESWQADHVIALINGGRHSESNLAPIHKIPCHIEKSGQDVATKSKIAKVRARHTGVKQPDGNLKSAGFPSSPKPPRISTKQPVQGMSEIARRYARQP